MAPKTILMNGNKQLILLMTVLILVLIGFIALVLINKTNYWYDEVITTNISQQSTSNILDVVQAEPHPPGIYFLLKFFPTENPNATRIFVSILSFGLFAGALFFAFKSNILNEHKLTLGILLFMTSYIWLELSTNIKQEFITFPLFIWSIFSFIKYLEHQNNKYFTLLGFIALVTMFFGYLYFIKIMALFLIAYFNKPNNFKTKLMIFIGVIILVYFAVFGYQQLVTNNGRFTWQQYKYNGPIVLLVSSTVGLTNSINTLFLGELTVLAMLFIFYEFIRNKKSNVQIQLTWYFVFFFIIDFCIFGTARNRYISELVFIFYLFVGMQLTSYLENFSNTKYKIPLSIILVLLTFNALFSINIDLMADNLYADINTFLAQNALESKTPIGLIDRHPNEAFIRKIGYFKDNNMIKPINVYDQSYMAENIVTRQLLKLEGEYKPQNMETTKKQLANTKLTKFNYVAGDTFKWSNEKWYYDPSQLVLSTLDKYCKIKDLKFLKIKFIIIFDQCNFN